MQKLKTPQTHPEAITILSSEKEIWREQALEAIPIFEKPQNPESSIFYRILKVWNVSGHMKDFTGAIDYFDTTFVPFFTGVGTELWDVKLAVSIPRLGLTDSRFDSSWEAASWIGVLEVAASVDDSSSFCARGVVVFSVDVADFLALPGMEGIAIFGIFGILIFLVFS